MLTANAARQSALLVLPHRRLPLQSLLLSTAAGLAEVVDSSSLSVRRDEGSSMPRILTPEGMFSLLAIPPPELATVASSSDLGIEEGRGEPAGTPMASRVVSPKRTKMRVVRMINRANETSSGSSG